VAVFAFGAGTMAQVLRAPTILASLALAIGYAVKTRQGRHVRPRDLRT
jgi:hypothetical protein